jgi:hypothetical protein
VEQSLGVVELSELIVQALVDTFGAALFSNVVLVGTLIEWSSFLAVHSDNPFTLVTESCSCG